MAMRQPRDLNQPPTERAAAGEVADIHALQSRWTLRQIQCFMALASTLHFGRAAEKMHMTQPAFSRQIMSLEESLEVRLVERDSQTVCLTPAGEAFLEGSGEALTALQNAAMRAKLFDSGFAGCVRVGYTDFAISAALPHIFCAFKQAYPQIVLESAQGATRDLLVDLRERRLDIVFVTGPIVGEGLESRAVASNRLLAVLYDGHPLADKPALLLRDLVDEGFIFGSPGLWKHFLKHIERVFDAAGYQPNVVETAFNSEGLFGLIAGKLGITLYPDCVLNYHRAGLVLRRVEDLDAAIPTVATWRSDDRSKALDHFRTVLGDCLEAAPSA